MLLVLIIQLVLFCALFLNPRKSEIVNEIFKNLSVHENVVCRLLLLFSMLFAPVEIEKIQHFTEKKATILKKGNCNHYPNECREIGKMKHHFSDLISKQKLSTFSWLQQSSVSSNFMSFVPRGLFSRSEVWCCKSNEGDSYYFAFAFMDQIH